MSLRTKQAVILLVATVLPFVLGGIAMTFVVAPAYRLAVAESAEQAARRVADSVAWTTARDAGRLSRLAAWDRLRELLSGPARPLDARDRAIDAVWESRAPDAEPVRSILENPVAWELLWWQRTDPSAVEVSVTDAAGRLVAASRKPADFLQADESWWRSAYQSGRGRIHVTDVFHDPVTREWVQEIAVPIYRDGAEGSPVVGILKAKQDVARSFQEVRRERVAAGRTLLVNRRGQVIVAPGDGAPLSRQLRQPGLLRLREAPSGQVITRTDDADLVTWAAVPFEVQPELQNVASPDLYVVMVRSAEEAFGPLRQVQFWMIVISLVTIAAAVALGNWLAEVLVVRQVRKLARGMRELARGDFDRATAIADELCRSNGRSDAERRTETTAPRA